MRREECCRISYVENWSSPFVYTADKMAAEFPPSFQSTSCKSRSIGLHSSLHPLCGRIKSDSHARRRSHLLGGQTPHSSSVRGAHHQHVSLFESRRPLALA